MVHDWGGPIGLLVRRACHVDPGDEVAAAYDAALPPAVGEAFTRALGPPAPHVLDGAGHFVPEDHAEEVGDIVADWLPS